MKLRNYPSLFVAVCLLNAVCLAMLPAAGACPDDADRERQTAERFLQVLLQNPRPGTALNQLYSYHVRHNSLNELLLALDQPAVDESTTTAPPSTVVPDLAEAAPGASLMVLGLLQMQRGKSQLAVTALQQAEKLRPEDAQCSFFLGKCYQATADTQLAAAAMERAIERQPERNDAVVIFTTLGQIYSRAGAFDQALQVWTKLEERFPADSRIGGKIAAIMAAEGKVEEALKKYESLAQSARKDEDKVAFAAKAAELKVQLGDTQDAIADLETILKKLRPGSWLHEDICNRIEDCFLNDGSVQDLADYYQNRLANDSDNLDLMTRLGRVQISAGRLSEACDTLENAVKRAPEDANIRVALIDVLTRQTKIARASQHYQQLAKQDPSNPDYLLKWGQLLLDDVNVSLKERRRAAKKIWQKLADLRSDDAVTLVLVADRMKSIDAVEAVIDLYRKAIDLEPASSQYREYLGEFLFQQKRKPEAIEVWESIAEGDRRQASTLIRLAEVFQTFKLPERSLESWKAASEFDLTFSQEVEYARQLRTAKQYQDALQRLAIAEGKADHPDEDGQLLQERIATYSAAGTLSEEILALQKVAKPSVKQLLQLALMQQAADMFSAATISVNAALKMAPENRGALLIAAELLERQNQLETAAEYYHRLAAADHRFQIKHLKKVADIQRLLGRQDEALKACRELIKANPASVDSYLFVARMAFSMNQTDAGDSVLRQAMSVAPRDNRARLLLASQFANRYRTVDAIEMYWQALQLESKLEKRIDIVRAVAPLYERRAEMTTLLSRIKQAGNKDNDLRATQLQIAAVHDAVKNYHEAREAIKRILDRQPRDLELLNEMVRLSLAMQQPEAAVSYQERVAAVNDTPENRFRLINMKIDAGLVDPATAWTERLSVINDPSQITTMIESSIRRGDLKTAKLIARKAIEDDDRLWDVKAILLQLLLQETPYAEIQRDSERRSPDARTDEINRLCADILNVKVSSDTPPPTSATAGQSTASQSSARLNSATAASSSRQGAGPRPNFAGLLLSHMRIWPLNNRQQSGVSGNRRGLIGGGSGGVQILGNRNVALSGANYRIVNGQLVPFINVRLKIQNYGEARMLAIVSQWVVECPAIKAKDRREWMNEALSKQYALPDDLGQITDPWRLLEYQVLEQVAAGNSAAGQQVRLQVKYGITPSELLLHGGAPSGLNRINWRLFELNPDQGIMPLRNQLVMRLAARNYASLSSTSETSVAQSLTHPTALPVEQLKTLMAYLDERWPSQQAANGNDSLRLQLTVCLLDECRLAGEIQLAEQCESRLQQWKTKYADLEQLILFYVTVNDRETAVPLVEKLLPALRKDFAAGTWTPPASAPGPPSIGRPLRWWQRWRDARHSRLIDDLVIAEACYRQTLQPNDTVKMNRTHSVQIRSGSSVKRKVLPMPYSNRLLDKSIANHFRTPLQAGSSEFIGHLQQPLENCPVAETKTRLMLVAYAQWWNGQPQQCCDSLGALAKTFPDDAQIQLEHARLLLETKQYQKTVDVLSDVQLLNADARMVQQVLTLNAAKKIPDRERAQQAARILVGMKLSTRIATELVPDLEVLNMPAEVAQLLTRNATGKKLSLATKIQMATSMQAAGNTEAAADIAFELYNETSRLIRGRNPTGSRTNSRSVRARQPSGARSDAQVDRVRAQAMRLMKTTGRLKQLIENNRKRLALSPSSTQVRLELSQLYHSIDQIRIAIDVLKAAPVPTDSIVNEQVRLAKSEQSSNRHSNVLELYLAVATVRPSILENSHAAVMKAAIDGKLVGELKQKLQSLRSGDLPIPMATHLLLVDKPSDESLDASFDESELPFLRWLFDGRTVSQGLYELVYLVEKQQRKRIPEIGEAIQLSLSGVEIFDSHSALWQATANRPWGQRSQELQVVLDSVCSDDEIRDVFERRVQELQQDPLFADSARLLQALVNLWTDELNRKTDDAELPSFQQLIDVLREINPEQVASEPSAKSTTRISNAMLMQIGSVIHYSEMNAEKDRLLEAIFDKCELPRWPAIAHYEVSYLPKYIQILNADQKNEKAIDVLLRAYRVQNASVAVRVLVPSQQSRISVQGNHTFIVDANPRFTSWVAEQLLELSAPAEALLIGQAARVQSNSQPTGVLIPGSRFPRQPVNGGTSGGQRLMRIRQMAIINKAESSLTAAAATNYFRRLVDRVHRDGSPALTPLAQPIDDIRSPVQQPVILKLCQLAATSDDGRQQLQHLQTALAGLPTPNSASLRLLSYQLTLACALKSDQVDLLTRQAIRQIESLPKSERTIPPSPTLEQRDQSQTCLAMLVAQSQYANAMSQAVSQPLVQTVCKQVGATHGASVALSVATEYGSNPQTIKLYQELLIEEINLSGMTIVRLLDQLKICQAEANNGQIHSACNRLKILLSSTSLEHVDLTVVPEVDRAQQWSESEAWKKVRSSEDKAVAASIREIVSAFAVACGLSESDASAPPDTVTLTTSKKRAMKDSRRLVMNTLLDIVFVDNSTKDVNPYLKQVAPAIALNTFGIHFTRDGLPEFTSASQLLVRLAAETGRMDEIKSRLTGDSLNSLVLKIQVAHQQKNADQIATLLKSIERKLDSYLPAADAKIVKSDSIVAGDAELSEVRSSVLKAKAVNTILHSTWPVVTDWQYENTEAAQQAKHLLKRARALIGSDQYTANRMNRIAKEIERKIEPESSKIEERGNRR